jgi:biotin synthase
VDLLETVNTLTAKALSGQRPARDEALAVLRSEDDELMDVIAAAFRVRRFYFAKRVKLNFLVNLKSGLCPEDCFYCSQRRGSGAAILKYSWLGPEEAAAVAGMGISGGARRVCLVASGRGPSDRDIDRVTAVIGAIKAEHPEVEVCACLGLLSDGQAAPCSGIIAGMGERDEDLVDVALALRELTPDSVPVNFLIPFQGTPLSAQWNLTPRHCLRILAMVRFVCPDAQVRLAAGREIHLGSMQPLALYLANSIFLGDYLTSEGQEGHQDLKMIAEARFTVEGQQSTKSVAVGGPGRVVLRQRGAGTGLPPNA